MLLRTLKRVLLATTSLLLLAGAYLAWNIWAGELRLKTPYGSLEHNYRGADTSRLTSDGPYLSYRNGYVIDQHIRQQDTSLVVSNDSVPTQQRLCRRFRCTVAATHDTFSFQLQPRLTVPPTRYAMPTRLLAVSDIEGDFPAFRALLRGAGVVDTALQWQFGTGHLVLVGDFFDRGLYVTECLWLIYKLEQEAAQAGGQVHYLLGNHEDMNLRGDQDDVRYKYKAVAQALRTPLPQLYGPDTELGRWLRTKNVVEQLGTTLLLHGGISPAVARAGLSLETINQTVRRHLGENRLSTLQQGGTVELLFGREGPMWYRGLVQQQITAPELTGILRQFQATRLVLGHTLVDRITPLYQGRVLAIDLPHAEQFRQGYVAGLWLENGRGYEINQRGQKRAL
ncbi:metallophosphoesterase [Hymenobacter sp. BT186]|uniref:Metallophosphoesterase n=1 Tax=Hymenobacter telluris TaxID=2816474 RepID=A0A939ET81_9BACT|nr:metallophosphoesterase [Hymenobacter telluris]MBO0357090.1 metallophosphoesterase [Hymenobacter telluris]MBW3373117.1 metallophosphoesterase [Hymenobacter norwichensis]